MWVSTIRRETTREELKSCRDKKRKARTVVGRGAEEPAPAVVRDPGSEVRLGGRENRRSKIINGMQKNIIEKIYIFNRCCTSSVRVRMYVR